MDASTLEVPPNTGCLTFVQGPPQWRFFYGELLWLLFLKHFNFFHIIYIVITLSPSSTPSSSTHLPFHPDTPLLFLSLENKQFSKG